MSLAVVDTSVYLEHFRKGSFKRELQSGAFLIRNSAVVLSELYRGCREAHERSAIDELAHHFPIVTPSESVWLESGSILAKLSRQKGYSADKVRDLHFDVLIALSARSIGAVVITCNRRDFEEIKKIKEFKLMSLDS